MELFITIIVCLLAGCGAGLGTGFAGMSAAVVITPMLVTFLDMPAYSAIGIALASDVLASGVSAYTYHKNKNIDIKNGLVMMLAVLLFTFVGSFVASLMPNDAMGGTSVFMTTLMGIK
ncbi:MAG: sulfite exporter TauE/SafE family protein, partial [Ruminiclostridium sp.]|nr:sulfite exporter TauE/SafE family protein [Ruminiclostridium sp.]